MRGFALVLWMSLAGLQLLLPGAARADGSLTYANVQPSQIRLGDSAYLTVTNLGNGPAQYPLPEVAGLQFEVLDQRHQVEMTNGVSLESTVTVIRVTPQKTGVFTIPQPAKQDKLLVLEVVSKQGTPAPYSNSFNPAAPPPPKQPPAASAAKVAGIHMAADGAAFVRLQLPKRSVYVGESVPVDIEVGARAGFVTSLNGLPKLNGAEFTLDNLSHQPERRELLIDGKPFVTLTWHSVIAAVKPGAYTLSVDTPLTVRFSTKSRQESAIDNMLGDPFLQRLFGATVSREVTVTSPETGLSVQALPPGAPAGFSGAVGSFTLSSDLSSVTSALGDPLTLRLHVAGSGNFDRVDSPMLSSSRAWKTYPPISSFKASDKVGHQGGKTFEQPVVALQAGVQTLPALNFTYFDPVAQKYQTAQTGALTVTVESNTGATARASPVPADAGQSPLRPDHDVGARTRSPVPLILQPSSLLAPPLIGVAFMAAWWVRRRVRTDSPEGAGARRARQAVHTVRRRLGAARRSGNPNEFLIIALGALKDSLATQWQLPVSEITLGEVERRLGPDDEAAALLRLTEELRYAPASDASVDFERWERLALRSVQEAS